MDARDFQQKFQIYQVLNQQRKNILEQLEILAKALKDSEETEEIIAEQEISGGDDVLAPLGKECYVWAKIKDRNKIVVDLGAGIFAEKTFQEAKRILESRKLEIKKHKKDLEKRLEKIDTQLLKMEPELRQVMEKKD